MPWLLKMTLVVAGIKTAVDLYLGWRLTRAVELLQPQLASFWEWIVIGGFLLFYLLPITGLMQYVLGWEVDLLTYPKSMVYLFWGGFAFSFQVLIWIATLDILKLGLNYGAGINAPFVDQGYGILVTGLSILILFFTITKMYFDTTKIETDKISYAVENLPSRLEGFKIVHISDIQADRYTGEPHIERYIREVNRENPDLVIFTGDLISYGTRYIKMAAHRLAEAEATHGVHMVIGDHDYWAGAENVKEAAREQGISVHDGENVVVGPESSGIRLTGITNVYSRQAQPAEVEHLTRDSLTACLKILASHQVSDLLIEHARAGGYHMVLGGHTHGGQIRVPFLFRKLSASDFETEYIQGPYWEDGMLININNGLGFTLAPVRYNARPNISVIELKQK